MRLLRTIIRVHSNPGDLVVDGFAGVSSTLIAAKEEKRKSIGFEIDKK
ncbi:MAG: site-specific DNA-methyltransferase [Candidatus Marinimicrobia bacterium]|nr:site-specific DNA-methyltransferase [Candidatus Neomarinimicrobiota bacterium]